MDDHPAISVEQFLSGWNEVADAHRSASPQHWEAAFDFLQLHMDAVASVSHNAGPQPTESDQAVLLLVVHTLNLYSSALLLLMRGQFDVASYLFRGLGDGSWLLWGCGVVPDLLDRFWDGTLKASQARRRLIEEMLARGEDDIAESLDARLVEDSSALNDLAHAQLLHGDKLVERVDDTLTPRLRGHRDDVQLRQMMVALLELEFWLMVAVTSVRKDWIGGDWMVRYERSKSRFLALPR